MNTKDIVVAWLRQHNFDGLAGDGCGCGVDDLMPCDDAAGRCEPAHKVICKDEQFKHCQACEACCSPSEKETAHIFIVAKLCGKVSNGYQCTMPAGSECPDCCGIRGETIGLED